MKYWILLEQGRKALEEAGIGAAHTDSAILLEYACGISKADYLMKKTEEASEDDLSRFMRAIEERSSGKPVQYITGHAPFFGLDFIVDENVLIPRFDTEVLVETVLKVLPAGEDLRILDMCTGSGCIAVSLAHNLRQRVEASDISEGALAVAKRNAENNRADVEFIRGDLFENIEGRFDVIVSNPPYIRTADIEELDREVRDFEPRPALDGTGDGLFFYKKITEGSLEHIKPGGSLFYEIGCDQAEDVKSIMANAGYSEINIIKDLAGLDRVIWGRYC